MKEEAITDEMLVRYALGQLSEQEHDRVEERMFADRELFERLLAVEDDLIDAYASGRLTGDERDRFEKYSLKSKEDGERVGFARELAVYVAGASKSPETAASPSRRAGRFEFLKVKNPWILLPLAASLLMAIGGLWLVFESMRLNDRLEQVRAELDEQEKRKQDLERQVAEALSRNEQLLEELERERAERETGGQVQTSPQASAPGLLSFILSPGAVRDRSGATTLTIPPDAGRVRLQALFKTGDYPSYSAELQTVEGRVLWERAGLKHSKKGDDRAVTLSVPASVFGEDDYILILNGVTSAGEEESVGEYYFRVARK